MIRTTCFGNVRFEGREDLYASVQQPLIYALLVQMIVYRDVLVVVRVRVRVNNLVRDGQPVVGTLSVFKLHGDGRHQDDVCTLTGGGTTHRVLHSRLRK